jgi:hypothetical protein
MHHVPIRVIRVIRVIGVIGVIGVMGGIRVNREIKVVIVEAVCCTK